MNIKITPAIICAIKKALAAKSITIPQMADTIKISRITLWRVYNGKQKTLTPIIYDLLQTQYLLPYLNWENVITDIPAKKSSKKYKPEEMIEYLQSEIEGLNTQIEVMDHEFLEIHQENKKLKSKLDKLLTIMNKN